MPARLCNVCATLNNWTDDNLARIHTFAEEKCSYLVYGKEVGHENNTPHLQIYAEYHNKISLSVVHRSLCHAHLEQRHGTAHQAAGYCKKGNQEHASGQDWAVYFMNPAPDWDGFETGECSNQGKRVDLDTWRDSVMTGKKTVDDITVEKSSHR